MLFTYIGFDFLTILNHCSSLLPNKINPREAFLLLYFSEQYQKKSIIPENLLNLFQNIIPYEEYCFIFNKNHDNLNLDFLKNIQNSFVSFSFFQGIKNPQKLNQLYKLNILNIQSQNQMSFLSNEKKTTQITKVEPEIILSQTSKKEKNTYIMKIAIPILLVTLIIVGLKNIH